jgi:beta-mannanase
MLGMFKSKTLTGPGVGVPISTTEKQISDLREAWNSASAKSLKQVSRYSELVKFTNALSDSYTNSIHVIIDVSKLLESYNSLLSDMLNGLKSLEQTMNTGVTSEDITKLRNITLKQIDDINNIFRTDFDKIYRAIKDASSDPGHVEHLASTKNAIEKINTKSLAESQSGGSKKKGKPVHKRTRKCKQ